MPRKKRRVKKDMLYIPHVWIPLDDGEAYEKSIRSAYCKKDQMQWFYSVKIERGFSDFEPVKCVCCNGSIDRGEGFESGFSCSDSPEVIACLTEHPEDKEILMLVFTRYSSVEQKSVLQSHLLSHDFSGSYTKVAITESGLSLINTSQLNKRKFISTLTYSGIIELKKLKLRSAELLTQLNEEVRVKVIKESRKNRHRNTKLSASAKDALRRLENATQKSLSGFQKFQKLRKKSLKQSQTKNLKDAASDLKRRLGSILKSSVRRKGRRSFRTRQASLKYRRKASVRG